MTRFLLQRLGLSLITLFLLSLIVFFMAQYLPGNVGRNILGPFADQHSVDILNHKLGVDRPLVKQYLSWIRDFFSGDLGTSLQYQVPVASLLGPSLVNSLKLAALAFVIVVPVSIGGGVLAALKQGRFADRSITIGGLSLTAVPEFVTAIVLIVVFGVALKWLPVTATAPEGSGFFTQVKYLLLPALALVIVLFGYIARITRAGTIEALDSDYTRTAFLKGLPTPTVIRRHVLRNGLLPTIDSGTTRTNASAASLSELTSDGPRRLQTGACWYWSDAPRLPWRSFQTQSPYWVSTGRSAPTWWL